MSSGRTLPWGLQLPADVGLDEQLRATAPDGRFLAALGLGVTLYIEQGDRPEVRDAFVAAYESYTQLVGPFTWGADPDTGEPLPLATSSVGDVRAWPAALFQRFDFQMAFHAGPDVDDADSSLLLAVSREREENELSYLHVGFPLSWAERHPPSVFIEWVLERCKQLCPTHGYAGLMPLGHVTGIDDDSAQVIYALGRRFKALEIDSPPHHAAYLSVEGKIKGVNWLTILGERWLTELHGLPSLRRQLSAAVLHDFACTSGDGGVVIQAGAHPRLGDTQSKAALADYEEVARALRPIRSVQPAVIWPQGLPGFSFDEAKAWMTRLD
jgi:hypothetical protein